MILPVTKSVSLIAAKQEELFMQTSITTRKLKGKDLITIGIFSAIYFVINFIFMLSAGIHPILWVLMPGTIALFTGIPYMLMAAKVQKPGAAFLMGLITGLIYFATGQFTVVILISMVVSCGLAELTRYITKYNSFTGDSLSFIFFSFGMVGSPLPIWLFKESFLAQIGGQGMPADYVSAVEAVSANWMLIILFVAPVIGGTAGALIARKLFKKHFVKAGII
jgi:energy-coupling factor transport system substrate-specific component